MATNKKNAEVDTRANWVAQINGLIIRPSRLRPTETSKLKMFLFVVSGEAK